MSQRKPERRTEKIAESARPSAEKEEAEFAKMSLIHDHLRKISKRIYALEKQIETMQPALDATPADIFHRKDRTELKNRIEDLKNKIKGDGDEMDRFARRSGFQSVREAENAYWRAKHEVEVAHQQQDLRDGKPISPEKPKSALASLEQAGLIRRERTEPGRANRLYVRIPSEVVSREPESENPTLDNPMQANQDGRKTLLPGSESYPGLDKNVSYLPAGELAPNKNYRNNNNENNKNQGEMGKSAYGRYKNVFLSEEELEELQMTVPDYRDYIEKISEHQESTGKQYQNHAATIHSWARRDAPKKPKYDREAYYHFEEGDSL